MMLSKILQSQVQQSTHKPSLNMFLCIATLDNMLLHFVVAQPLEKNVRPQEHSASSAHAHEFSMSPINSRIPCVNTGQSNGNGNVLGDGDGDGNGNNKC